MDNNNLEVDTLIKLLLTNFYENFAHRVVLIVVESNSVGLIYELATQKVKRLKKNDQDKITFRAAYLLETIYFEYNNLFMPYRDRFFNDFLKCENGSAKRHFSKIMAQILKSYTPSSLECSEITEKCIEWVIDVKVKVAVKIWCIEILILLVNVGVVSEVIEELFDILEKDATPAITCRLKRWRYVRIV